MGQLHIILGLTQNSNAADATALYCGRDGDAARAVMNGALGSNGWPVVEHLTGVRGYRKQGVAKEAPVIVPAGKELDEVIAANHSLKEEIDLLDVKLAEQKAQMEKDAASIAELLDARDALTKEVGGLRQGREQAADSLKHAEARIELLSKELSSVKAEKQATPANTTVGESAPGPAVGAAGPGASTSPTSSNTPPPGSQGSDSEVSSSAPTAAPQRPAAAPKGTQQQANAGKGR